MLLYNKPLPHPQWERSVIEVGMTRRYTLEADFSVEKCITQFHDESNYHVKYLLVTPMANKKRVAEDATDEGRATKL
jgi:hypothetical protein